MNTLTPRASSEEKIGDTYYRVRPLGAKKGCQVMTKITRVLGAAVAKGASTKEALIFGALGEMTEDDLSFLCDTFAEYTDIKTEHTKNNWPGLKAVMELHFSANYGEMFEWLAFCLKLNFGSVFDRAKAVLVTQKATAAEPVAESPAA